MTPLLSNQLKRARTILEAVQQGINPSTNEELPRDSIVNDIEVNRAIGTALMAIDQVAAREARRAQLPDNVGRQWSKEEENQLIVGFKSGDSPADLATRHGRTNRAIEARLEKLALITICAVTSVSGTSSGSRCR